MKKIRAVASTPKAILLSLVLLAGVAHATPVLLFAASINPFQIFTSRDAYLAAVGLPDLAFNFNGLPDQQVTVLELEGLRMTGDIVVQQGALNFSAGTFAAMNFSRNIFAWGADITPLGGAGLINFTFGGLSVLQNFNAPGFFGFAALSPFGAINASFLELAPIITVTNGPAAGVSFVVDNMIANSVPAPSTLVLLTTGLGLLGLSLRRRKAETSAPSEPDNATNDPM